MAGEIEWWSVVMKVMSKRLTWVSLFLIVYAGILSSSWNLISSIRSRYTAAPPPPPRSAAAAAIPALFASVLYGGVFGIVSMFAALAIAVPATLVTWITVLVLLAFAGKPRADLVRDGRRITADILGIAIKVLLREGNIVAAICVVVSFVAITVRRKESGGEELQQ